MFALNFVLCLGKPVNFFLIGKLNRLGFCSVEKNWSNPFVAISTNRDASVLFLFYFFNKVNIFFTW